MEPLIYEEIETKGFGCLLKILEEQRVDVKLLAFMIWAFRTENLTRKEYHYRSGGKYLGAYIKNLKEIFELTKKIAASTDANFIDAAIERIKKIEDLIDDNLNIAWKYRIKGSLLDTNKEGSDENYKKCYRLIKRRLIKILIKEKFPRDWKNWITKNIFIRTCKISGGHAIRLNRLTSRLNRDLSSQFFNYIFNDTFGVKIWNNKSDVKEFKPAVFLCDIIKERIRGYNGSEELQDFLFINWGSGISRLVQRYYYNNLNDEDKKRNNPDLVYCKPDKERISIYKDYLRSLSENKSFPALIEELEAIYEKNFTVEINPKDITIIRARSRGRPKKASDEIELETLINSMLKKNNITLEIIAHVISFLGIDNLNYNNGKWKLLFQNKEYYDDSHYLKLKKLKTIKETALKIGRFTYNDILELYNKEFKWDVNDTPLSAHCKICEAYKYTNYKGCLKNMNCNLYYRYAMFLDLNPAVRKWFFNF